MDFITVIVQGLNASLSLYLAYWMYSSFGITKYSKIVTAIIFSIIATAYTCTLLFVKIALVGYFSIFTLTLLMSMVFKMKAINRFIYASIFYVLSAATEMIVALLISQIFNLDFNGSKEGVLYVTGMLLSKFMTFLIVIIIRVKHHVQLLMILKKNNWSILAFPVATFAIILLQHGIFVYNPNQPYSVSIFVVACYTLLIVSNIIIFEFIDILYKNTMNESKVATANDIIEKQTEQYKALIEHNDRIRTIRHDHRNFCIGILNELKNGNIENAINRITVEYDITSETFDRPNDIVHTTIDLKRDIASKDNIYIDFEYHSLNELAISTIDLAIILGNALDNAIEATREVRSQKRIINVFVALKNQNIVIGIKNPIEGDIDTNNLKTKKNDPEYHGFGIISMKQLANKYGGDIIFVSENNIFSTTIIMNNIVSKNNE
jgi:hypothetical protein